MPDGLADALRAWAKVLGPAAVIQDEGLAAYTANVTGHSRSVLAALAIRQRDQLTDVVAVARDHGIPLHPISTGRNWGLGSRLPVRDGAVIVDLSGMNQILALDHETGTVVVEPGVTQGQLAGYLEREAPGLVANMTGSAADTSLVGNTLDRGIGYLADRLTDLVGLEVVLGTGRTLRTGEWPTSGRHHGPHWHHGIGPPLESLFVQSNFGIVSAAALRLRSRPPAATAFRLSARKDGQIVELLDALAGLHRDSVLTMPTRTFDAVWTHGSLTSAEPAWTTFGGLSGRPGVVDALRRELRKALKPLGRLEFGEVGGGSADEEESSWWRSVLSVMGGRPTDLSVTNWASRVGVAFRTEDLDATDFGMLCEVRAIPFAGEAAYELVRLAREVCARHSMAPCVSLSALDGYTMEAVFILLFNRSSAEQTSSAHACAAELRDALTAAGVVPHRVGIDAIPAFVQADDGGYWQTLADLKRALDPDSVISPGRYNLH